MRSPTKFFHALVVLIVLAMPSAGSQPTGSKSLFEMVTNDDSDAIRNAVVNNGVDINQIGPGGQTPLVSAVLKGKLSAVKTLLDLGADVTIPEKDGYTVMHAAGFQGRHEILQVLAAHNDGAINILDQHPDGFYPIHRACWGREQRHTQTVQTFLDLGVPVDLVASNGKACVAMTRNEETMSVILKAMEVQRREHDQGSDDNKHREGSKDKIDEL